MDKYTLDKENMGLRIRAAREAKGWTRERLAEEIGVSVNSMACVELGKNGMRLENLSRICELLDLNADYVLFGTPPAPAQELGAMLRDRDPHTVRVAAETLRALLNALDQ